MELSRIFIDSYLGPRLDLYILLDLYLGPRLDLSRTPKQKTSYRVYSEETGVLPLRQGV